MQWVPALFPGITQPGSGGDHTPPSSAKVKERVELYLSPPQAFMTCSMENFLLKKRKGKGHPTTGHDGPEVE